LLFGISMRVAAVFTDGSALKDLTSGLRAFTGAIAKQPPRGQE
jgi:hypothetical protein